MKKIFGKLYCDIHRALLNPSGTMPADQAVELHETNKAIKASKANKANKAIEAIEKKNR